MTQYIYAIPVLFMTIFCMLFLTITNEHILKEHKKAFLLSFLGEFFIIVCEVLSLLLNGSAIKFKGIHFLSNYLGFLLSPILIIVFSVFMGRLHRSRIAVIGSSIYFILCNVLVVTKQLFFIDAQNNYHRGNLFSIYIISYFLTVLYLLYETLRYSRKGFLKHKVFAYLLSICFLISSCIQVFNPEVYMTRITVILSLCIYYAYNIELTSLFDKLTGVLNQGTYLRKVNELKEQQYVMILDVDNFKCINDQYGHQYGDKCLRIVSQVIKSVFESYGHCYRIGGDEFAIILNRHKNMEELIERFESNMAAKFKGEPCKVSVSIGYSKYEKNDSIDEVIERADRNMYTVKNQKKSTKENLSNNR